MAPSDVQEFLAGLSEDDKKQVLVEVLGSLNESLSEALEIELESKNLPSVPELRPLVGIVQGQLAVVGMYKDRIVNATILK